MVVGKVRLFPQLNISALEPTLYGQKKTSSDISCLGSLARLCQSLSSLSNHYLIFADHWCRSPQSGVRPADRNWAEYLVDDREPYLKRILRESRF